MSFNFFSVQIWSGICFHFCAGLKCLLHALFLFWNLPTHFEATRLSTLERNTFWYCSVGMFLLSLLCIKAVPYVSLHRLVSWKALCKCITWIGNLHISVIFVSVELFLFHNGLPYVIGELIIIQVDHFLNLAATHISLFISCTFICVLTHFNLLKFVMSSIILL